MAGIITAPFAAEQQPNHLTKRAFQSRFPLMPDGVSRKYDSMSLFLSDDSYAASLIADSTARLALRLQIQAGLNRMNASGHVDLDMDDAANFTLLLMQGSIPASFRLTAAERDVILSKTISAAERPAA